MNLAFITNYDKTIFYHAIGQQLSQAGHNVFYISPSQRWANWLIAHEIPATNILDLTQLGREWEQTGLGFDCPSLRATEESGGIMMRDIIMMDRYLSKRIPTQATSYLAVANRAISQMLLAQQIQVVVSEPTWAIEVLTSAICRCLKIPFLSPEGVRIPPGRFAFYRGVTQQHLFSFDDLTDEHRQQAAHAVREFRSSKPRPWYLDVKSDQLTRIEPNWLTRILHAIQRQRDDRFDETNGRVGDLANLVIGRLINFNRVRWACPFEQFTPPPQRPFVLYAMQVQPESSIDVFASSYTNQVELIRALARTLPCSHDLYVKEHPQGLGLRSLDQYRRLKAIPGVRLIDPRINSFQLSAFADLVISVTGTISFEAAVMRRPALCISPMFFNNILVAPSFDPYTQSLADLLKTVENRLPDDTAITELLAFLFANSFEGLIAGPALTKEATNPQNITKVTQAFEQLTKGLARANN